MRLICVAGMPGCGKEEFVRVAEERGIDVVRMGDLVREEAAKRMVQPSRDSIGILANEERLKYGYGVWAERTLPRLKGDVTVIDGIRCPEEIQVFTRYLRGDGELIIVAIHAPPRVRMARLFGRKREDDATTKDEFHVRDMRELKWGVGSVLALADFMLLNMGSIEEFRKRAEALLGGIAGVKNRLA